MTEITPHRPLDAHDVVIGDVRLIVRSDLTAHLLTTRAPAHLYGAIRLGPCDLLLVEEGNSPRLPEIVERGAALLQDMTSAFAVIDIVGADVPARLGLPHFDPENGGATRLADLRVIAERREAGFRVIVGRSHADYLWSWLVIRLAKDGSVSANAPTLI